MPRGKQKAPTKSQKARVQTTLEQGNLLPHLKKPLEIIGKQFGLPGKAWGDACPQADVDKLFQTTVF